MAQGAPGFQILPPQTITTAVTGVTVGTYGVTPTFFLCGDSVDGITAQCNFVYGSGGTNATAYLQTSLDAGVSWIDIMSFQFTTASGVKVATCVDLTAITSAVTPGDGALSANTAVSGIIGDRFRVKYTTTGTYAGSTTLAMTVYLNNAGHS